MAWVGEAADCLSRGVHVQVARLELSLKIIECHVGWWVTYDLQLIIQVAFGILTMSGCLALAYVVDLYSSCPERERIEFQ